MLKSANIISPKKKYIPLSPKKFSLEMIAQLCLKVVIE